MIVYLFLDAIASPSTYPCQSVSGVIVSDVDSYRISELCELVIISESETAFQRNFLYLTGTKSPKPMVDSVMKQKYMPVIFNLKNVFAYL